MRRTFALAIVALAVSSVPARAAGPVCSDADEEGQISCTIATLADCQQVNDYPYHRNLFCPAAFSAAQTIVAKMTQTLGQGPSAGTFTFFQTKPKPQDDDPSQTDVACLDTPAPWPGGSSFVQGAGNPLCHLVAYVTSVGPVPQSVPPSGGNPVPTPLRQYPSYFSKLYAPVQGFPLLDFRTGSAVWDPLVRALGKSGFDGLLADYPQFSTQALYDPEQFQSDPSYQGMSGGGGGGWGGEISIVDSHGARLTLLAFGGGGGGGLTSFGRPPPAARSALGAGGGGGMQFGNAYRSRNVSYSGLGLGAGTSSDESDVQYSYNSYDADKTKPQDPHIYNPKVINQYLAQLANLMAQLQDRFGNGKTIAVTGGGGMGGGAEYLRENEQEWEPHALSTQAGFQFVYQFSEDENAAPTVKALSPVLAQEQADLNALYEKLGDFYKTANDIAFETCGKDYSNFKCMCPLMHSIVICLAGKQLGSPDAIPDWMQEQHCPDDSGTHPDNGFTSYQRLLLAAKADLPGDPPLCTEILHEYFARVNAKVNKAY